MQGQGDVAPPSTRRSARLRNPRQGPAGNVGPALPGAPAPAAPQQRMVLRNNKYQNPALPGAPMIYLDNMPPQRGRFVRATYSPSPPAPRLRGRQNQPRAGAAAARNGPGPAQAAAAAGAADAGPPRGAAPGAQRSGLLGQKFRGFASGGIHELEFPELGDNADFSF